jgi:hypothetical protein
MPLILSEKKGVVICHTEKLHKHNIKASTLGIAIPLL